ncbi:MAG: PQQ-dependent sugar dehydrogenase [Haloechinothrix sp.]
MRARIAAGLASLVLVSACTGGQTEPRRPPEQPTAGPTAETAEPTGALVVEEVTAGLEHGWDIGFLPDGQLLVSERPARLTLVSDAQQGARATEIRADLDDVYVTGEGGLMGLVVHPDFAESREFTTCQTHAEDGEPVDVRLVTWRLAADGASAEKVRDLLTGLPLNPSGRHSGCRPTMAADGSLLVGTGDTARPDIPQDRGNLGGKVLRIDLDTGEGLPDNPFADSGNANERRLASFGHRNVQGVAVRPGSGQVFIAEHGPAVDDEVNLLEVGGNYGWDPSRGGTVDSYDESVPMTDLDRFPDAVRPLWTSGDTTEAIGGAAFLTGQRWGSREGALAVTALRGSKLLLFTVDEQGAVTDVTAPAELDGTYGRLRAARTGPDGALYLTTTNGDDDTLLRVTPS